MSTIATSASSQTPKTKVMGILNLTPDSFYDGGKHKGIDAALKAVGQMIEDGAEIVDVGGMSTRPGAKIIHPEEEQKRVLPSLEVLKSRFPNMLFSIDTIHPTTAGACLERGASIINDVSGEELSSEMLAIVAKYDATYVLMHSRGTPATMQSLTRSTDVVEDVYTFLQQKIDLAASLGANKLILDPGFGFSKTLEQNYQLLHALPYFKQLGKPILVGLSRKSMIQKVIGTTVNTSLNGTTALHMIALTNGANILRVHDVKEAVESVKLFAFYEAQKKTNAL